MPSRSVAFDTPFVPPTRVRYGVLLFLALLSFVLYLDRICMGQAAVSIQSELELSDKMMGWVHAAFTIAYGLFEVPTGRWGDKHGSRGVLVRIVVWWSVFTALTGAASTLAMLLVVRFLFGAGEAGAFPNSARVIARWFPAGGRGPAQGIVTTSSLLGGVLAPIAAQLLISRVGWRWTFVYFGGVGIIWAIAFYLWYRDDPAEHPAVNQSERLLIKGLTISPEYKSRFDPRPPVATQVAIQADAPGAPAESIEEVSNERSPMPASSTETNAPTVHESVPWGRVFGSANLWLLGFVISCSAFASYLYFSWYPTYLVEARGLSKDDASRFTSLVLAGGAIGCLGGGYFGDWLVRRTGERRWSRRFLGSTGLALAAMCLLASIHCDNALHAAMFTTGASLTAGVALTAWWAVVTDVSGQHLGVLFGLLNSLGVPGAFASQVFFGWMADFRKGLGFDGRDRYDPAFYVYAGILVAGAIGWLFIDSNRSLVGEPKRIELESDRAAT
jgi:MFS family permease